jgi:hypothetical protein
MKEQQLSKQHERYHVQRQKGNVDAHNYISHIIKYTQPIIGAPVNAAFFERGVFKEIKYDDGQYT